MQNDKKIYISEHLQPAGDVTRVSAVLGKVTVKIGDAGIADRDAGIKLD